MILQIASGNFFSTYGGGQVYVKNIVDEFVRQQKKISVLSFLDGQTIEKKNYKGADLYEANNNISEDELSELIKNIDPSLIHAHSHKALICRIGRKLNIPVIVTAHHGGILCPAGALLDCEDNICYKRVSYDNCLKCCLRNIRSGIYWYPFVKHLNEEAYIKLGKFLKAKPLIPFITPIGTTALSLDDKINEWNDIKRLSTVVIAPSNTIAKAMEINGLDKRKVQIIPHGIPLPDKVPSFPSMKDGIKFFYVGRICYVKGVHIMLEAFSKVKNKKIALHIVGGAGNNSEKRYMKLLIKKYKSDGRIIWHGKVEPDKVFNTIKDFHIQIHPTICMEIFGLNISESLAMNKPVLASRCGGAEMQITDGINGWLVEPNNIEALKGKIEEVISNINKINISLVSQSVVSINNHIIKLCDLYKKIVK